MRLFSTLDRKLLRDLWRLRAQSLAIALLIASGVGMVVMSFGMLRSMEATRQAYYDLYRFADIEAPLKRAPESLLAAVRRLPGVAGADSRVSAGGIMDVPGIAEPVGARIHSLPREGGMNALVLRQGRLPAPGAIGEVVANEAFARAARLAPGDGFSILLYGKEMRLRPVGTVLSAEYVYAVAPGQIFPDNRRFGILWMDREPLAAALDLTDGFNDLLVRTDPGASEDEVVRRLDILLAPYGGSGAFPRKEQISDRFVTNELEQLATTTEILPPIFLGVAAFLLNIVLARLVDTEREVIGLLKAFGYRNRTILIHYAELALLLSVGGLLLGYGLGTWLGRELAVMYQRFFTFPFLRFRAGADVYLLATAATLAAVLVGAGLAVARAARLTPAEAMRPEAPSAYAGGRLSRLLARVAPDEPSRIILRGLVRRPLRSALTVGGLAAALGLYIASASSTDNVERMIELIFGKAERGDMTVLFAEPRDAHALHALERLPGVIRVEPFRGVGARLVAGPRVQREGLSSVDSDRDLGRVVGLSGEVVEPPAGGAILSSRLARDLEVRPGDTILAEVTEGERPTLALRVNGVVETPIGSSAWVSRPLINRLMREGASLSGARLLVDPARQDQVFAALKQTPMVAAVTIRSAMLRSIRDTIAENMGIVTLFNTGFAALIVLGVVYNGARISLSERARDLASLRVLGFRKGEVAFVLLGEQALLLLLSLPVGLLFGVGLARYVTHRFSGDLYTIPFAIGWGTLGKGVLVVCAAALLTALLIRARVDRLDLVRALKTRE